MKKVLLFVKKCNGVYLISINERKYHMHNWKVSHGLACMIKSMMVSSSRRYL